MAGRRPVAIADALTELMARRGYARVEANERLASAWREAAGSPLAEFSQVGGVRRGTLEVAVANSTWAQELTYRKAEILKRLAEQLPDERIVKLRLKVAPIG